MVKKNKKLGKRNTAILKAEQAELAAIFRERSRGGGSGAHENKSERRMRTRKAKLDKIVKEELSE